MGSDWKFLLLAVFIFYVIVMISFEYPIFGIIVLISIIAFSLWMWSISRDSDKEYEKIRERETQKEKKENDLLDKIPKEIYSIIENNIKIIASAYRKSVTSNSFGKKNYNKFIPELVEFIEDNSKIVKKLREDYDNEVTIKLTDSVIEFLENKIEKLNQDADYTDDMDPFEYEHYCAEQFKKGGWEAEATQGSSDQGVDVKASKDGINLVAQCKKFAKPVSNKAVQEVVAGMKYYGANKGIVIAPNGFTKSAEKLAESNNIDLIHHSEIKDL